ncbi:MAG: diacylglycerol kinase family protein [Blastocatellales bacterium]
MFFIINPTAARGRALREWIRARKELIARGVKFDEHLTKHQGEAVEVTRWLFRRGEDTIIAVGGDGTLNEIVNGYFDETGHAINSEAAIGLLPAGTGSDFRRSVGLITRDDALNAIKQRETALLDVLRVELLDRDGLPVTRHSINVVSFGLGGEAVALVNAWRESWPRWIGGRPRFVVAALKALRNYKNRQVVALLDGGRAIEIISNFFVVANGRFAGGGMMLAPHAELSDGLCDVVMTDGATRWDIIRELPGIQRGAHLDNPKVSSRRASKVEITCDDRLAVDIDGEAAGFIPAKLTVVPSSVRFIIKARS